MAGMVMMVKKSLEVWRRVFGMFISFSHNLEGFQ